MDQPLFYVVLFIHLTCLILAFGSVMVIDTFGLLWLLKKVPLNLVTKVAETTQKLIWAGYTGMILSGSYLIFTKGYIDNLTKIKIFLVIMIGLNGIFLHTIKKSFEKLQNEYEITQILKFRMFVATSISQTGWWGAMLIGFVHRHIQHNIPWPSNPWIYMFAIAGLFLILASVGEITFKSKNKNYV